MAARNRAWRLPLLALTLVVACQASGAHGPCAVPSSRNPNHVLEGADFQYKLSRYFTGEGPPPLEEVFFATQNLSRTTQETLMRECPGLLISAFVVLAEARLPIAEEEAKNAIAKAEGLANELSQEVYDLTMQVWPVVPALASFKRMAARAEEAQEGKTSVHLVVCHCGESLDWLTDGRFHMPAEERATVDVFIYEKCNRTAENEQALKARYNRVSLVHVDDGDIRRDECSGYLRHLVDHYDNPADHTLFFQADAGDHMQWGYLSLVMRGIERRALEAGFVHLNYPRLVASLSPCREEVFRQVFNRPPKQMLGSYCCAQFAVSRERIQANPKEVYERMQQMLFGESPKECHDIPGASTHCLMFEVYWHVLFGEQDALPERAENPSLPLFLRIRDLENESYLPPGSLYLQLAMESY